MADQDSLIQALKWQAAGCAALGSAFSAGLLERTQADVAAAGPTPALFAPWRKASARTLLTDTAPLRFLGALHDLVLSDDAPALARAYPRAGHPGDLDRAWPAVLTAIGAHGARLEAFMTHEPQTNEVLRSACLLPGFLTVASEAGFPLRCFELGASAGLNQLWDHYRYRLGTAGAWGPPGAAVSLETDWRGRPPPLDAAVTVAERAACDRKPVDLTDPAARRRLRAYVWPDQVERLSRLDAAIAAALSAKIRVAEQDAVSWAERIASPMPGAATVLFHSVFWQYMPAESQSALAAGIEALGARAVAGAPFAWLRMEPAPNNMASMDLRLTLWPGGEERILATVHPHGAWVEWMGG